MQEGPATPQKIRPDFVRWKFGDHAFSSLSTARSADFSLSFKPSIERRNFSFRQEVFEAAKRIDEKRQGRPVALCFSGGVDSELIAFALHELGVPFRAYFLDLWGLNREAFENWAPPFLHRLGKKAEVVRVERARFYEEHSVRLFEELGVEYPTYLALPLLFDAIPENEFIVAGDGDLNRGGPLFEAIAAAHPAPVDGALWIPFATSATAYWNWAEKRGRAGEYCFFSSTPGLIAATVTHPLFRTNYPFSDGRELILAEFPEIAPRPRTTNWDGLAYRENVWLRAWLERHGRKIPSLHAWRSSLGTIVRIDDLFIGAR
jgi:hypothetical protein